VIVVVGDPINFDDLITDNSDDTQNISRGILYDKASERIGQQLQQLKAKVDRLAAEHRDELENRQIDNTVNDGYQIWQQVDWESFGIGNMLSSAEQSLVQEPPKQVQHELLLAEESISPPKQAESELHLEEQSVSPIPSAAISRDVGIPHWFSRHADASELMGFAARGLFKNGRFMEEGYRQFEQSTVFNVWREAQGNNAMPRWSTA
jgi:monolysocardiolipin acyltransferase